MASPHHTSQLNRVLMHMFGRRPGRGVVGGIAGVAFMLTMVGSVHRSQSAAVGVSWPIWMLFYVAIVFSKAADAVFPLAIGW